MGEQHFQFKFSLKKGYWLGLLEFILMCFVHDEIGWNKQNNLRM